METEGLGTQPSATTFDLEDLVQFAWSGKIRVPHFQRDFRWSTQDISRLFDSIVKGYPIGSLLLWVRRSPAQLLVLGSLEISAPADDSAYWVVDGQQRITSLANALHPKGHRDPRFNLYYDLAKRRFVTTPRSREPQYIPLPTLFDLVKLLDWFAGEGRIVAEFFSEAQRIAKILRQFKVPAYLVRQEDEDVLKDIFDRMNNYGKRLSRAEIFSALFAGPERGASSRLSLSVIAEHVATRTGFGVIDNDTVLAAVLARRGPDPARDIRNEFDSTARRTKPDFPDEDRDTAYAEGEEALVRAVEFLQRESGVPHLALLAYRAPLVALTRFFAHFPEPEPNSLRLLRRLYWRVAVSGPAVFKGSFTAVERVLSARIKPGDERGSVAALMATMTDAQPSMPTTERFRTNDAATKIILSSWWDLGPRSFVTGEPFSVQDLSNQVADDTTAANTVYRIFTQSLAPSERLMAANRVLLPGEGEPVNELGHRIGGVGQFSFDEGAEVDGAAHEAILASHNIDGEMVAALRKNDRSRFLALRNDAIVKQLRHFLDRMAEWDYEDTPALSSFDLDEMDDLRE